uniref:ElpA2 protein n=1 Tax=Borreliella burgdorferi TaxID=139 RepID=Q9X3P0_BORBG|nr:ElpA2 protein [Borreliella burgdorferi 297]
MNKKIKIFIICTVVVLISSCKYYARDKDLKQNVKEQIGGFLDTKERIVSDDPTVYGIAEKLKEEELKGKKENTKDVNLENKEDSNKNDLKDHEDATVLKPEFEPIALENKEPKLEIAEILKPELPEMPKLPVVVKPVVKEKTEEEKAKDKEYEELKRRRIEHYQKQEEERLKRKKQREERKKLRELKSNENYMITLTKGVIFRFSKDIDKIINEINSINLSFSFEEKSEISGKDVEDRVTGAIYDYITDNRSNGNSIYSEWSDYLEEEENELKSLIEKLEKARTGLRGKIKEVKDGKERNKNVVGINDIKEDLEKLKDFLIELKEYLQNNVDKKEIHKAVKCSMNPDDVDCE